MGNELGTEKLKQVATDAIIVAQDLVDAAKDGIQLSDTLVIFKDLGKLRDVATNAKQALAELKDLAPDETTDVVEHVVDMAGLDGPTGVEAKIRGSLRLVARAHRTITEAVDIVGDAKDLFD